MAALEPAVEALETEYDVSREQIRADMVTLLEEMVSHGLAERLDPAG